MGNTNRKHHGPCRSHSKTSANRSEKVYECRQHGYNELHFKLHEAILQGETDRLVEILQFHPVNEPIKIWNDCALVPTLQTQAVLPIHLAATYRKENSLERLLLSGANPEMRDLRGRTALHLVITHWPSIAATWAKPQTKFQRAMAAMQRRAEACLGLLCRAGVDINAEVASGCKHTALHLAVRYRAPPAVGILAGSGADVNATDRLGMTPLHMAAGTLSPEVTAALLDCGADIHQVIQHTGATALHLAVFAASAKAGGTLQVDLDCTRLLLAGGARPDAQDRAGRSPLHDACRGGREEVVDLLLLYGGNVNLRTAAGENCLFLFLDRGPNLQCASLLGKLLSLTYPLRLTNGAGHLPGGLTRPESCFQRELLLLLSQQPLRLQDICRIKVRQQYGAELRTHLKDAVPQALFDFVYSNWDSIPGRGRCATGSSRQTGLKENSSRTPGGPNLED
ncbi:ankyrin repeat domain-containing protein 61 [Lepisosteus oculatus]|uniref:ankyrin repeat domain-containing protein 61 n=1 Tax=Lepisosteus oculatus TaxID=7918 RepID=UPI0035F50D2E